MKYQSFPRIDSITTITAYRHYLLVRPDADSYLVEYSLLHCPADGTLVDAHTRDEVKFDLSRDVLLILPTYFLAYSNLFA